MEKKMKTQRIRVEVPVSIEICATGEMCGDGKTGGDCGHFYVNRDWKDGRWFARAMCDIFGRLKWGEGDTVFRHKNCIGSRVLKTKVQE